MTRECENKVCRDHMCVDPKLLSPRYFSMPMLVGVTNGRQTLWVFFRYRDLADGGYIRFCQCASLEAVFVQKYQNNSAASGAGSFRDEILNGV